MLRLRLNVVKTETPPCRYYYVGKEVAACGMNFVVTDIRAIDRTVYVYVIHNGKETLFDRFSMDHVMYLEGVTFSDEVAESLDRPLAEVVLEAPVCVEA